MKLILFSIFLILFVTKVNPWVFQISNTTIDLGSFTIIIAFAFAIIGLFLPDKKSS